jgi:hypothetical protein
MRKCREAVSYDGYTSSAAIVVVTTSAEIVSMSIGCAPSADGCADHARWRASTAVRGAALRFFVSAAAFPAARRRRVVAAFLAPAFRRFVAAAFLVAARRRRVRAALAAAAFRFPVFRAIYVILRWAVYIRNSNSTSESAFQLNTKTPRLHHDPCFRPQSPPRLSPVRRVCELDCWSTEESLWSYASCVRERDVLGRPLRVHWPCVGMDGVDADRNAHSKPPTAVTGDLSPSFASVMRRLPVTSRPRHRFAFTPGANATAVVPVGSATRRSIF